MNYRSATAMWLLALAMGMTSPSFDTTQAIAGEVVTEPENRACGNEAAREAIAGIESAKGDAGYAVVNKQYGYLGKYQIGEAKLVDLGYAVKDGDAYDNKFSWTSKAASKWGISSNDDFLSNKAAQEAIYTEIDALNTRYLGSAMNSIGKSLPCGGTISKSALLAGSQLGAGKVQNYIRNGMKCEPGKGSSTNDAFGTCVEKFMCAVSGCNVIEKDMSKNTCDATMPILDSLQCSNLPAGLQGFCQTYKPYLMTRNECEDAEAWAKSVKKGPQEEKCENLTFGVGSGSWSWVLACSYASDAVADQDGVQNPQGPISDPACIQTLESMGVEFDVLGQVQNGSYNGKTCIVENAVSLSGTAVPFGAKLTMTCDMAVAMERWGQQMRGLGATAYYSIGSTRPCGPMRDKNGDKPGTITEHALGRAVDVSGFYVGDRKISMGAIHNPSTPDGALAAKAKDAACGTFRGVLSPTYSEYAGKYVHFHVEWGNLNGTCR